ncbi:HAD-like domain-containing protein [Aspergillus pseudoustus]|uniref:HAD-like domain-containing protein n=1 Tax=Aspergillus pseudoustus TaxID=1810923 RepID=A0ABR4JT27_9EURO
MGMAGKLEAVRTYRGRLAAASWVGFDLDDTLHEFRSASSTASKTVFVTISGRHGIPTTQLQDQYTVILRELTSHAFSDGRTSHDYRRERFVALLEAFSVPVESEFIQDLLALYESSLKASLRLKTGAANLLQKLISLGKKIVVVTEGPQDAQEWTIANLSIAPYIDYLVTTNKFGATKTTGLFSLVLKHLNIDSNEIVFIGDNLKRDIEPATEEGILCIYLAENEGSWTGDGPFWVKELAEIETLLETRGRVER